MLWSVSQISLGNYLLTDPTPHVHIKAFIDGMTNKDQKDHKVHNCIDGRYGTQANTLIINDHAHYMPISL